MVRAEPTNTRRHRH